MIKDVENIQTLTPGVRSKINFGCYVRLVFGQRGWSLISGCGVGTVNCGICIKRSAAARSSNIMHHKIRKRTNQSEKEIYLWFPDGEVALFAIAKYNILHMWLQSNCLRFRFNVSLTKELGWICSASSSNIRRFMSCMKEDGSRTQKFKNSDK